jgi:hypothetical protein
VRAIAAWWHRFDQYNRTSTRTRIAVAAVAAVAGLLVGMAAANASILRPAHVTTQVSTLGPGGVKSHFSARLDPLGHVASITSKIHITKDSRNLGERDYTKCAQPVGGDFFAVGPWHRFVGQTSQASCPAHDVRVDEAGFQYYHWKFVINTSNNTASWVRKIGTHPLYKRGSNS